MLYNHTKTLWFQLFNFIYILILSEESQVPETMPGELARQVHQRKTDTSFQEMLLNEPEHGGPNGHQSQTCRGLQCQQCREESNSRQNPMTLSTQDGHQPQNLATIPVGRQKYPGDQRRPITSWPGSPTPLGTTHKHASLSILLLLMARTTERRKELASQPITWEMEFLIHIRTKDDYLNQFILLNLN